MKKGDIVVGDCTNCFTNVKLEFQYKEGEVYAFVCESCGTYIYLHESKLNNVIHSKQIKEK